MNVNNVHLPPGWKAEWSAQYGRYFYIDLTTNQSTWTLPSPAPPAVQRQHSIQRKPVPGQKSPTQGEASSPVQSGTYVEAYPTPPPQVTTGHFPPTPVQQQPLPAQAQVHYVQPATQNSQQNPQQECPQATPQQPQQPQYAEVQESLPQHHSSATQPGLQVVQSPVSVPQQQYPQQHPNYITPSATANSTVPQYPRQNAQTMSPPPTPSAQSPQQPRAYAPSPYNQQAQRFSQPGNGVSLTQFVPQQRGVPTHYPQQVNNLVQYQQQPQQNFAQSTLQYQHQQPNYTNQQPNYATQQAKRSSMIGGSPMGGSMMNKMSTKFTSFSKPTSGPPADWKKWAKRATIGAAGIGALALGVDAAGDMFSGAEGLGDFGGGGEMSGFEGGGFEGGGGEAMDAQTAVDASNAQLTMEGIGQDNASMLCDPVGTTYTPIYDAQASQNAMGLI